MLADGQSLVTQVVPQALVDMACTVMRSTFSGVISKRVYTLEFDRSTLHDTPPSDTKQEAAKPAPPPKKAKKKAAKKRSASGKRGKAKKTKKTKKATKPTTSGAVKAGTSGPHENEQAWFGVDATRVALPALKNTALLRVRLLKNKLVEARRQGSVVVTTPESIKALLLTYVEYLKLASSLTPEHQGTEGGTDSDGTHTPSQSAGTSADLSAVAEARGADLVADALADVLQLFGEQERGIALLDEVDLLLHPLKSELNFPIGAWVNLAPVPARFQLPIHLVDAVLFEQARALSSPLLAHAGRSAAKVLETHSPFAVEHVRGDLAGYAAPRQSDSTRRAGVPGWDAVVDPSRLLLAIVACVRAGEDVFAVQRSPHTICLDRAWYTTCLRPLIAAWATHWLLAQRSVRSDCQSFLSKASDGAGLNTFASRLLAYVGASKLQAAVETGCSVAAWATNTLSPASMLLLNLSRQWVTTYLPHCLSKVNRVAYGLLQPAQGAQFIEHAPLSRKLLAVPFVGKDVPSKASEFANPEVLIGLTVLALRHEGMRATDLRQTVAHLKRSLLQEPGAIVERPSRRLFDSWLADGNCGYDRERVGATSTVGIGAGSGAAGGAGAGAGAGALSLTGSASRGGPARGTVVEAADVLPLELIQVEDEAQMTGLLLLVRKNPRIISHWLQHHVFPRVLRYQRTKLTASGQDLGSDLLFGLRLGFSGTPSELLPRELGKPGCVLSGGCRAHGECAILTVALHGAGTNLELRPGWYGRSRHHAALSCTCLRGAWCGYCVGWLLGRRTKPSARSSTQEPSSPG